MSVTEVETFILRDRCLLTDNVFREVCKLTRHILDGPLSSGSEMWIMECRMHWSRVTRALQRVFRNRCGDNDVSCNGRSTVSTKLLDTISTRCFNALRVAINISKKRFLSDPDDHVDTCIRIATIIQTHTLKLRHFLVRGHSWDNLYSHNCTCCTKTSSQVKQSGVIEQFDFLLRAVFPWQPCLFPVLDLD